MNADTFITIIGNRSAVVTVEEVYDGAMVEFYDAITGEHRGCAGIHWWNTKAHRVPYTGRLPKIPEKERWVI